MAEGKERGRKGGDERWLKERVGVGGEREREREGERQREREG